MSIKDGVFNTGEIQRSALPILILQSIQKAKDSGRTWMSDIREHLNDRMIELCERQVSEPLDAISVHFSTVSLFLQKMEQQGLVELDGKNVKITRAGRDHLDKWTKLFKEFASGV